MQAQKNNTERPLSASEQLGNLLETVAEIQRSNEPSFFDQSTAAKTVQFQTELTSFVDGLNAYTRHIVSLRISDPFRRFIEYEKKPWLKNKVVAGLFGPYSSGKSSLLNALLDLKLPENLEPSSALPTYVVSNAQLGNGRRYYAVGKNEEKVYGVSDRQFELFDQTSAKKFPFHLFFQYLVVSCRNELLDAVTFLDSPGVENKDADDSLAAEALGMCDVVFWVVPLTGANATVGRGDFEFIKKNFRREKQRLYVILTWADQIFPGERNETAASVGRQFKSNGVDFEDVLLFTNDGRDSEFGSYYEKLKSVVQNLGQSVDTQRDNPLSDAKDFLELVRGNLEAKYQSAHSAKITNKQKREELENKLSRQRTKVVDSFNRTSPKFKQVADDFVSLRNVYSEAFFANAALNDSITQLGRTLQELIESYQKITEKFNHYNPVELVEIGACVLNESRADDEVKETSRKLKKCEELIRRFDDFATEFL